jgi:hypothetical protein
MGTFIGMSESRKGITSVAETATNVPCDSTNNRRIIRPTTNILNPPSDSAGTPGPPENPPLPSPSSTGRRRGREGGPPKNQGRQQNQKSLCPFFSNVIEVHKTKYTPYSKFNCLLMVQCFTIYGVIMSVIGMFVALTQVDFMLIRIAADLVVNSHTMYCFLRGKEVDPVLRHLENIM